MNADELPPLSCNDAATVASAPANAEAMDDVTRKLRQLKGFYSDGLIDQETFLLRQASILNSAGLGMAAGLNRTTNMRAEAAPLVERLVEPPVTNVNVLDDASEPCCSVFNSRLRCFKPAFTCLGWFLYGCLVILWLIVAMVLFALLLRLCGFFKSGMPFISFGQMAHGWIAIGQFASGFFCISQFGICVVHVGMIGIGFGMSVGMFSAGLGLLVCGGGFGSYALLSGGSFTLFGCAIGSGIKLLPFFSANDTLYSFNVSAKNLSIHKPPAESDSP